MTYLRVNLQGRGVFNEGFNDTSAPECVGSHHEHLVLLHGVEERSHVGPDGLYRNNERDGQPSQAHRHPKTVSHDFEGPYTMTFLGRREPLGWAFFNRIWRLALGAPA